MTQMLRSYSKYEMHAGKDVVTLEHFSRQLRIVLRRKTHSHAFKIFRKEKETSVYGKECEAIFGRGQTLTTQD